MDNALSETDLLIKSPSAGQARASSGTMQAEWRME